MRALCDLSNKGACPTSFQFKGQSLFGLRNAACFDQTSEIWYKDKELESSNISVRKCKQEANRKPFMFFDKKPS